MTSIIGPRNSAFGPGARRLTRRIARWSGLSETEVGGGQNALAMMLGQIGGAA